MCLCKQWKTKKKRKIKNKLKREKDKAKHNITNGIEKRMMTLIDILSHSLLFGFIRFLFWVCRYYIHFIICFPFFTRIQFEGLHNIIFFCSQIDFSLFLFCLTLSKWHFHSNYLRQREQNSNKKKSICGNFDLWATLIHILPQSQIPKN